MGWDVGRGEAPPVHRRGLAGATVGGATAGPAAAHEGAPSPCLNADSFILVLLIGILGPGHARPGCSCAPAKPRLSRLEAGSFPGQPLQPVVPGSYPGRTRLERCELGPPKTRVKPGSNPGQTRVSHEAVSCPNNSVKCPRASKGGAWYPGTSRERRTVSVRGRTLVLQHGTQRSGRHSGPRCRDRRARGCGAARTNASP